MIFSGATSVLPHLRELLQGKEQEIVVVLILDAQHRVLDCREVARGEADTVQIPVREVFRAVYTDARALVLAHNHPGGNPEPSRADVATTKRLREAGETISLPILDHIIIGEGERYYSFVEAEQ